MATAYSRAAMFIVIPPFEQRGGGRSMQGSLSPLIKQDNRYLCEDDEDTDDSGY